MRAPWLRCSRLAVVLLTGLLFLSAALPAIADDASLGRVGECVRPIDNNEISMVAEDITVIAEQGRSMVTCSFTFRNEGPAVGALMGFPEQKPEEDREGFADDVSIHDFTATVDGKRLNVEMRTGLADESGVIGDPAMPSTDWWTFTVPFAAGEERTVVNTYWVKNLQWSNGEVRVGYTLITGRTWKGPIGHIKVKMVPRGWSVADLTRAFPGGYTVDADGTMVWEYDSVEPGGDIVVQFNHRAAELNPQASNGITAWEKAVAADTDDPQTVWLLAQAYRDKYGVTKAGSGVPEPVLSLQRHAGAHAQRVLAMPEPGGWSNEGWIGVSRTVSAIAGTPEPTATGHAPVISSITWQHRDEAFSFGFTAVDLDGDLLTYSLEAFSTDTSGNRSQPITALSDPMSRMAGDGRSLSYQGTGPVLATNTRSITYRITTSDFSGLTADTGEVTLYLHRDGTLSPVKPGPVTSPWLVGLAVLTTLALAAVVVGRRRSGVGR